jgi:5-deoxy-glucuronate isomerase
MYIDKKVQRGYNPYMEIGHTDCNTNMDVGLLVMEEGDVFELCEAEKEVAYDLLQGKVEFAWNDQVLEADRPDTFHYDAYCLHVCKETKVVIKALSHAEIYVQKTVYKFGVEK